MLNQIDLIIIAAYLLAVLCIGLIFRKHKSLESYFCNNRNSSLIVLACASLSTSVGAGVVLGTASASFSSGISYGILLIIITTIGWLLAAYFAPQIKNFGDQYKAYTLSDYLEKKYSLSVKKLSRIIILTGFLILTALQFIALSQMLQIFSPLSFKYSLLIVATTTILYTTLGGLRSTFYTSIIQTIAISFIFILLITKGLNSISIDQILQLPKGYFSLHNFAGPTFFWFAVILGIPLVLCSADCWQRIFSAKDIKTAQKSIYITCILKSFILLMSLFLGLMAFHLTPNANADGAVFALMSKLLTPGLLGLGIVSLSSIIMSTIDSSLMVGSSTITKDFFLLKYPNTKDQTTIKISKVATIIFGSCSFALAYFAQSIVTLTIVSAQIMLIFSPALLGSLIFKSNNHKAAYWSILLGFILTITFIPFTPNIAFIPGLLTSITTYLIISKWKP